MIGTTFLRRVIFPILILSTGISGIGYAQYNPRGEKLVYFEIGEGTGNGNFSAFHVALNTTIGNKANNLLTLGFYYYKRTSPECPADYHDEKSRFLNPFASKIHPLQELKLIGATYGKVIYTSSEKIRFTLKAGILAGLENNHINFVFCGGNPNYTSTSEQMLSAGILLNPLMELTLSRHFGFNLGLYATVNPTVSVFGIHIGIILGKIKT